MSIHGVATAGAPSRRRCRKPPSRRSLAIAPIFLCGVLTAWLGIFSGCSLDDLPDNPSSVLVYSVPKRVNLPGGESTERRYLVDGIATDPEWAEVPYSYVALGPENGNQGEASSWP